MFWDIVFYLGIWQLAWWVSRVVALFYRTQYGTQVTPDRYGKNSWAVVTGSSDGIGLALAKNLAHRGFNIVLMARSVDKLNDCANKIQQIKSKSGQPIKTRVIQYDFSSSYTTKDYQKIYSEKLSDIDVSVLINNVGVVYADI
jgi:17beta-estradiol 17-dehydrogenase / very-long-chain 3-oxoacyl-CoA reductase